MKYLAVILITFLLATATSKVQAQNTDSLHLKSTFWGNKFYKGDTIYSMNAVLEELAVNEAPYNLMINAKKDFVFAQILGGVGGLLIGIPIGTALVGGQPNWVLAGIGAGVVAITIPISINFKKKANKALKMHNSLVLAPHASIYSPQYNIGLSSNGLLLQVRF